MLLALAAGGITLTAQGESQRLPGANEVAGSWLVKSEGAAAAAGCRIQLAEQGRAVLDPQHCLQRLLGLAVTTWAVQPDGIVLASPDGGRPVLFSRRDATRFSTRGSTGYTLWLEPLAR